MKIFPKAILIAFAIIVAQILLESVEDYDKTGIIFHIVELPTIYILTLLYPLRLAHIESFLALIIEFVVYVLVIYALLHIPKKWNRATAYNTPQHNAHPQDE